MTEPRCPECARQVEPGFRVCPDCAAPLGGPSAELPVVTPARREGRNGLAAVGAGLVLLGLLGFVGVILSLTSGQRSNADTIFTIGGGSILMLIAGSVLASIGWRKRGGGGAVVTGVLGGVAAALMGVVLGGLLVIATILYAIQDCLNTCNSPAQQQQRR